MAKIVRINNVAYTERETLERKYTNNDAVAAAKVRLGNRPYCTNALYRRGPDRLTLPELNDLADSIVDDTVFYG